MKTKQEYRREVKKRMEEYDREEISRRSSALMERLSALEEIRAARRIALYWPLPGEVDTLPFLSRWGTEKELFLPVMVPGGELVWRRYDPDLPLYEAAFGVMEPIGENVNPDRFDAVVVPGLAFDRANRRLGRGKGYYDRFLSRFPGLKIGVCFDHQYVDKIPVEEHDIPVDRVITG